MKFSLHYHYLLRIKEVVIKDFKMYVLIFRRILLSSSIRNAWRTVRRICIFISGFKGLKFVMAVYLIV